MKRLLTVSVLALLTLSACRPQACRAVQIVPAAPVVVHDSVPYASLGRSTVHHSTTVVNVHRSAPPVRPARVTRPVTKAVTRTTRTTRTVSPSYRAAPRYSSSGRSGGGMGGSTRRR